MFDAPVTLNIISDVIINAVMMINNKLLCDTKISLCNSIESENRSRFHRELIYCTSSVDDDTYNYIFIMQIFVTKHQQCVCPLYKVRLTTIYCKTIITKYIAHFLAEK